jgi:DNA/RNA-binding domain of Phe-tRNA-synthetase-like protein
MGIKPGEYRPSMDALVRRVLKKDPLPAINRIVDIGNLVSIQHLVPIGAHAIDLATHDMALRLASGAESFELFGSEALEHPNPSEIIFARGDTVLTRRWTWRQAKQTLVLPSTTAVEINVDALALIPDAEVKLICDQLVSLVNQTCGGELRIEFLSAENPIVTL